MTAAAAACTRQPPATQPGSMPIGSTPPLSTSASVPTTDLPTATSNAADLAALKRVLGDRLIVPSDAGYRSGAQLFDPRFDAAHPIAIARCASASDVQHCLEFVRTTGTPLAARSGGHSYGGYSTTSGLVIDVGPMNAIGPGKAAGTARIGAGARLADVYATLAASGTSIPAGSCPTVGITGLALGGGIGVVGRKYGLSCDTITAVEVVTADGNLVRCDENAEPDLFWAHRGGGGGNFGVVTALEFRTHATTNLSYFLVRWDWAHAADVVAAWQSWLPTTPDELWASLHLDGAGSASDSPHIYVSGVFVGGLAALQRLLDDLQAAAKAPMSSRFAKEAGYLQTMLIEGGCADLSTNQCRPVSEGGKLLRASQLARSDFIAAPLSSSGIDVVLGAIDTRRTKGLRGGAVLFDAYGGAINRVGATETAFAHRDTLACLQYATPLFSAADALPNRAWLDDFYQAMRPHVSGYAYQNYIDPGLPDWQHAYYGVNLARLISVKSKYDPNNLFRFAQSVPIR